MVKEIHVKVRLSELDLRILQQLTTGEPRKCIATSIGMSFFNLRWQLGRLFGKLGVNSRQEAVALALRNGWIK